jgi:hypothetical protein
MAHEYIFPVIELCFASVISGLLFNRYKKTTDKSTFYWMLAFMFYSAYGVLQLLFISRVFVINALPYYLLQFVRQTLISLMFVSVYYGIIRLLTDKKLLTLTLPIAFFSLQEILLAYADFFVLNIEMADKLHVIFFDVPFNLIIALLFFKLYQVNRRRYSLMIALAWLGYALLVPIYFYTAGNAFIYTLSLTPMFVMLLAFMLYYKAPTGEAIMEIVPAVEKKLSTPKRYKLKPGLSYLVEEPKSLKAFDVFMDAVTHGIRGLCITRVKPDWVRQCYGIEKTPVLWLTQMAGKVSDSVDPSELEQFVSLIDTFVKKAKEMEAEEEAEAMPEVVDKYAMSTDELREGKKSSEEKKEAHVEEKPTARPEQHVELKEIEKPVPPAEPRPAPKGKFTVIGDESDVVKSEQKSVPKPEAPKLPPRGKITIIGDFDDKPKEHARLTEKRPNDQTKPAQPQTHIREFAGKPVPQYHHEFVQKSPVPPAQQPKPVQPAPQPAQSKPIQQQQSAQNKPAPISQSKPVPTQQNKPVEAPKPVPDDKPKYINKKKGGITFIGASDELKRKLQNKTYFELPVSQPRNRRKSIILLDGLEYMISNNSFDAVKKMLTLLKDKISEGESCLVVPIDPNTLTSEQMAQLRAEFVVFEENGKKEE